MTKYRVVHTSHYSFQQVISHCVIEARLKPVDHATQKVEFSQFVVRPLASTQKNTADDFGNNVSQFEITRSLQSFELTSIHTVLTFPFEPIDIENSTTWESLAVLIENNAAVKTQYMNDASAYVTYDEHLSAYASLSFLPKRPILEASFHLMQRINKDFSI